MPGLFSNLRFPKPDFSGLKRAMSQASGAAAQAYRATENYLSDAWDRGKYALSDYGPGGEAAKAPHYKKEHTVPGWWFWGLALPLPLIIFVLLTTIATNTIRTFQQLVKDSLDTHFDAGINSADNRNTARKVWGGPLGYLLALGFNFALTPFSLVYNSFMAAFDVSRWFSARAFAIDNPRKWDEHHNGLQEFLAIPGYLIGVFVVCPIIALIVLAKETLTRCATFVRG